MKHTIYLVATENDLNAKACKVALEKEYPSLTFDADRVHGVLGVRIHIDTYDLETPMVKGCRDFAKGYMACLEATVANEGQSIIDKMNDSTLHATYVALKGSFPLNPEDTCNGMSMSDWYTLVFEEVDRRRLPT